MRHSLESPGQSAPVKVLLIDDDPDDLELMSDALSESIWQFEVDAVTDPKVGRQLILSGRYDAFLIDWRLGAESGIDLVAELAPDASGPMIAITGRHDQSVDRAAQAAGAFDYLQKEEVTPEVLSRTIRYAVQAWEERQRFQAIFDQAPVGLFGTSPDGTIKEANPALTDILRTDLVGHNALEFYVDPMDRIEAVSALRRGEEVDDLQVELERADGSRLWASIRYRGIYDDEGELTKVFGTISDITERRRLAEQRELEERHQKTLEREKRTHLEEKARLQDEFLALISHELRTPLTSIIGYVETLREGLGAGETEKFLEIIDRNARRLHQHVSDLLTVARLDASELSIQPADMDMGAVVGECVETARPQADARGVELSLTAESVPMVGDRRRLSEVIDNLVSNALKFTPRGGSVELTVEEAAGWVIIVISDTGEGIAPEDLPNLFHRFYRTQSAERQLVPGTGLGLSIVKAIVEAHGGSIDVNSTLHEGTSFTLRLPIGDSDQLATREREETWA